MSQHDYVLDNDIGSNFRVDLNTALGAIATNNSGATEPVTMYAYQWWADTTTGLLKRRNSTNTAWVTIMSLDSLTFASPTMTGTTQVAALTASGLATLDGGATISGVSMTPVRGTWTPVIYGTTSAGTGTYTAQVGVHTKIGDLETAQLFLQWTAHTGTGNMRISGLPDNVAAALDASAAIGKVHNITLTAGNYMIARAAAGQAYIILLQVPTGGGAEAAVPMGTAGILEMTITFRTA